MFSQYCLPNEHVSSLHLVCERWSIHVYTGHSYPCRVLRDFYMHYKTIAGTKVWVGRSSENFV